MATVKFILSASLPVEHFIAVVGDAPEIGKWALSGAEVLEYDAKTSKWCKEIQFGTAGLIKYRYLSGIYTVDASGAKNLIIRDWEAGTASHSRSVHAAAGRLTEADGDFGVIDGKNVLQRGMLCEQREIRLNISDNAEAPIVSWLASNPGKLRIKFEADVGPLGVQARLIKSYTFTEFQADQFIDLPKKESEVVTYVAEVVCTEQFVGYFTISDASGNTLGCATIVGHQFDKSIGRLALAILDRSGRGIGSLNLEYVVIHPYKTEPVTMEESFASYWKKKPTINVGHRGSGNSFTAAKPSDIFENTIAGFKAAASQGADMVELDVQLTKDKVPVVFHDFTICTSVASKNTIGKFLLHEIEVQDLSYVEALEFKTRHRFRKTSTREPNFNEDDTHPHNRPFPTLQEVLEEIPETCGVDVELKWPHYIMDKSWYHDVRDLGDANDFLDRILDVVFKYAGKRRIVFSCFEANICVMVRRKQHKYPVVFLANEGDRFMELRSRFNSLAVPFSASEKFLGFCTEESSAYTDPSLVQKVHDAGLRYFLYGDNIAEPKNREILSKQGADGIIFDRIHQVLENSSQKPTNNH